MSTDPQTVNLGYFVPVRGSDVGHWDEPMNANYQGIDATFSAVSAISLSNADYTLSLPVTDSSRWQANNIQSALLRFTGSLSTNVNVTLPRPGFWLVENLCTGAFVVKLKSATAGKVICAPPGEMVQIFCDGTDCKYVAMGRVGEYVDIAASAIPAWISNCTVPPYVNCDGSTVNASLYPVLAGMMTKLPDIRGRGRASLNQGQGWFSTKNGGVDGDTLFASGGRDTGVIVQANLPNVSFTVADSGHFHYLPNAVVVDQVGYGSPSCQTGTSVQIGSLNVTESAQTGITVKSGGKGEAFSIVTPVVISGLTLIRAA